MDWDTLITSLGGTVVIVAAAGFILKSVVQRMLDFAVARIQEENKEKIREKFRVSSRRYDEQIELLHKCVETTYRIRNSARDVLVFKESDWVRMSNDYHRVHDELDKLGDELRTFLFGAKSKLPVNAFDLAHDFSHGVRRFLDDMDEILRYYREHTRFESREHQSASNIKTVRSAYSIVGIEEDAVSELNRKLSSTYHRINDLHDLVLRETRSYMRLYD